MLKSYLKIAYRNLRKNTSFSFINILGLTAGLLAFFLILEYISFEKSYDRFHSKADRVYRLAMNFYQEGDLVNQDAMAYAPTGPELVKELPEVINFTRISPEYGRVVLRYEDKQFEVPKVFYADSTLFELFDFPLLEGDPRTALAEPSSILLTQSAAEKYFGPKTNWADSPVGKSIRFNQDRLLKITGILGDVPENSHIKFNALLSFTSFPEMVGDPSNNWGWNDFYNYVLLDEKADPDAFAAQLPDFINRHKEQNTPGTYDEYLIQPLSSIHLNSHLGYEAEMNGDAKSIYFLSLVAILILILAWINYVNLSTARAQDRAREVGVRKVVGASRASLLAQFLTESMLVNLMAILLALAMGLMFLPLLSKMIGSELGDYFLGQKTFWLLLPLLFIGGSLLSGLYPAFILSAMSTNRILKNSKAKNSGGQWLRKGLVTFQYSISVALIAGALIIFQQLRFMQTRDLGFSLQQTLVLNSPSVINNDTIYFERMESFRNELAAIPGVKGMTASSAIPGKFHYDLDTHGGLRLVGQTEEKSRTFTSFRVDENFVDAYGLQLIAGESFSREKLSDGEGLLLNRSATRLLGFEKPEDAVGKKMQYWGNQPTILGVIEDYHHKSLRNKVEPTIIRNSKSDFLYYSLTTESENGRDLNHLIAQVEQAWERVYPDNPINYFFLDQQFNDQYKADQLFGRIVGLFSLLAILIACLGLFGLASYAVSVRTKEIGIRKVLGAPVSHILLLLNKNFLQLLLLAFVISIPLAYYLFSRWLENFAYQTPLQWWYFGLPCLIVLIIALLAISGQSLRAALGDPVKALRYE